MNLTDEQWRDAFRQHTGQKFSDFDWPGIAQMLNATIIERTEKTVLLSMGWTVVRRSMTVLITDNGGGEMVVSEVVHRDLHTGVVYDASLGPRISNLTLAARLGWAIREEPIDWSFHCPDEVEPAPEVPPFQAYLLRMGFEHCARREDGCDADLFEKQREGAPSIQAYMSAPGGYGFAVVRARRGGGKPVRVYEGHSAADAQATVEKMLRAPTRRRRKRPAAPVVQPEAAVTCKPCDAYRSGARRGAGHKSCDTPGCECYCSRSRTLPAGVMQ